jgi:hypothetical protein
MFGLFVAGEIVRTLLDGTSSAQSEETKRDE